MSARDSSKTSFDARSVCVSEEKKEPAAAEDQLFLEAKSIDDLSPNPDGFDFSDFFFSQPAKITQIGTLTNCIKEQCKIEEAAKSEIPLSDISSLSAEVVVVEEEEEEEEKDLECKLENSDKHPVEHIPLPSLKEIIASLPADDSILRSLKFQQTINEDPEATVPRMRMDWLKNFKDLLVYIAHIFDPAHIWCHVAYPKEVTDIECNFDVFNKTLNERYKSLDKKDLHISRKNLKEGMIVAGYVKEFASWYRVRVVDFNDDDDSLQIYCIDYGTVDCVQRSDVRYLFKEYMQYSEYCFRGRLYKAKPPEGRRYFKATDVERFISFISCKRFFATLQRYDEEEDAYEMSLERASDDEDLLSFVLSENIGVEITPEEYDKEICLAPMCYILPTFELLETNYPDYSELYALESVEINFNKVIDSNFFHAIPPAEVERDVELLHATKNRQFRRSHKYLFGRYP